MAHIYMRKINYITSHTLAKNNIVLELPRGSSAKEKIMTKEELSALGLALYGYGWQSYLARALDVNIRTVQRWKSGDVPVPDWVEGEIKKITGADVAANPEWPRDEWISGAGHPHEAGGTREYLIHAHHPRFICRVVELDELTEEPEVDEGDVDISGISYCSGNDMLCEFVWLDAPPPSNKLTDLLEAACDSLLD